MFSLTAPSLLRNIQNSSPAGARTTPSLLFCYHELQHYSAGEQDQIPSHHWNHIQPFQSSGFKPSCISPDWLCFERYLRTWSPNNTSYISSCVCKVSLCIFPNNPWSISQQWESEHILTSPHHDFSWCLLFQSAFYQIYPILPNFLPPIPLSPPVPEQDGDLVVLWWFSASSKTGHKHTQGFKHHWAKSALSSKYKVSLAGKLKLSRSSLKAFEK